MADHPVRVAVINDYPEFLELVRQILEERGLEARTHLGASTPIEEVAGFDPHLLIVDLNLVPGSDGMDGWEYLRRIRAHPGLVNVPVLVSTADLVALRNRRGEVEALSDATLAKPFTLEQFERSVAELVGARRLLTWDDEHDLVLVADATAHLVDGSSAVLRQLGLDRPALRTLRVADIVAQTVEWTEREWQRYLRAGHWEGRVDLLTPDGPLASRAVADIITTAGRSWHISRLEPVHS